MRGYVNSRAGGVGGGALAEKGNGRMTRSQIWVSTRPSEFQRELQPLYHASVAGPDAPTIWNNPSHNPNTDD